MATVNWHLDELTGSTLTLRLYPLGSGTIANAGGDVMSEAGDGLFSATVAETLTGWHKAYADRSGVPVAEDYVQMRGSTTVTIGGPSDPTQVVIGRYTDDDADSPHITCKVGETGVIKAVSVTDFNGDAVDLTDWGDKVIYIERALTLTDVQTITNASITISGAGNDTFSFTPSSTVLAQPGDWVWSLREVSTQDVIIDGTLAVSYSPIADPAP